MSHLRRFKLAALLVPTACALVACVNSDRSSSSSGGSGSGDPGGSGGSNVYITPDTSGPAGPSAVSGSASSGRSTPDLNCTGDEVTWKQLTAGPIACTSGEECCVIMNPCHAEAQIVAKENTAAALAVWPSCSVDCTDCVARAIEVACVDGSCLGRVIAEEGSFSPLRKEHCGTSLQFVEPNGGPTAVQFSCGPGPGP